jgi:hypothetical protein
MKLAESFKILTTTSPGIHARALRAIGQDLADLFPETLEIEMRGDIFIVRLQCPRSRFDARQAEPQRKSLKEFCADILSRDLTALKQKNQSATIHVNRRYAPEDIDRIDEFYISRRFTVGKIPDIRSLGEILRTIGRLVDGQEGQLVKIFKETHRIVFEFTDSDGKPRNELMSILNLYKLQKRFYETRGELVGLDPWKNRK